MAWAHDGESAGQLNRVCACRSTPERLRVAARRIDASGVHSNNREVLHDADDTAHPSAVSTQKGVAGNEWHVDG